MARKPKDHKEAYRKRIVRGEAKGLSRAAARGHARSGDIPANPDRRLLRARDLALNRAMDRVADGEALTAVAKASRISREALRRYIGERAEFRRVDGRFRILGDRRRRQYPLYTAGTVRQVTVDRENARSLGRYMAAVGRFLHSNREAELEPFKGGGVTDGSGHRHLFETDPETLYALDARGEVSFQSYNTEQDGDNDG